MSKSKCDVNSSNDRNDLLKQKQRDEKADHKNVYELLGGLKGSSWDTKKVAS